MRRSRALRAVSLAVAATVPASGVAAEQMIDGWPRVGLDFAGDNIVYSQSTVTTIAGRGATFPVYRTDTYRLGVEGAELTGPRTPGIVLRTSAGTTTGGLLAGTDSGRHVLVATGVGFTPQVVFCCFPETGRAFPVETEGRPGAPVTVAATLDGEEARYVTRAADGQVTLRSRNVGAALSRRLVRPLGAVVAERNITMSGAWLAWIDAREPTTIKVATVNPATLEITPVIALPQSGTILRILVEPDLVSALVLTDGRYRLLRFDAPTWVATEVWSDVVAPGPLAVGGKAVTYALADGVYNHVPGRPAPKRVSRAIGRVAAVATDAARIAILERRTRTRRGIVEKRSIIRMSVDTTAPGAPR